MYVSDMLVMQRIKFDIIAVTEYNASEMWISHADMVLIQNSDGLIEIHTSLKGHPRVWFVHLLVKHDEQERKEERSR
jgi:hypothetical protein